MYASAKATREQMLTRLFRMSGNVQVFGRRHDESMGALKRSATEKRQGTKSRWGMCGGAASTMGIWSRRLDQ